MALSMGELDPGVGAASVPVFNGEDEVVGALAVVGTVTQLQQLGSARLRSSLERTATQIRQALTQAQARATG
jgi:DNA-binding IclR family transcriptional regulator